MPANRPASRALFKKWRIVYTNNDRYGVTFLSAGSAALARSEFISMYPNAEIDVVLEDNVHEPAPSVEPVMFSKKAIP